MKKDSYIYPCIFNYEKDGITIIFPDLPGCVTCARTDEEAFFMAKDALGGHIAVMEEYKENIPEPTMLNKVEIKKNERAVLIQVDMPIIREAVNNKAIKKTLTIPAWLNTIAEREGINFSYVLQKALKDCLNLEVKRN